MSFNSKLIAEIQQRNGINRGELAKMLGVSKNQLYRIEKGIRQPSLTLIRRISALTGLPVDTLLDREAGEAEPEISRDTLAFMEVKRKLERKCEELLCAQKYIFELERQLEHSRAIISLHVRFADIKCDESLTRSAMMKKLEKLAIAAARENEATFMEICAALRMKRAILRRCLSSAKQIYKCRFAEDGEIMASNPGEAALRLRCFDCESFESGECGGHGNEKRPENIIELVESLEECGVIGREEQAGIIEESYNTPISGHELSDIIYRHNNGFPIPESIFYLDGRGRKK
jgi:transcriptional regulator with XRE-family HTH domain